MAAATLLMEDWQSYNPYPHKGNTMTNDLFGAIEGGGTKFVCAVGKADGQILVETRFPTNTPDETLGRAIEFFQE